MRMGITFGRNTMGRPARVRNAGQGRRVFGLRRQLGNSSYAAQAMKRWIQHCQASRIVTTIFKLPESFYQDRNYIILGNCRDDAAHEGSVFCGKQVRL
jgi:hypothetical protein